jgi:hypothetical protein
MDNVQIEVTNACKIGCSNCTHLVGHAKPWFMALDAFKEAVDSLTGYPKIVGMIGGETLNHPDFEAMCNYLHSKFPKEQCGLWTALPEGFERYRETIVETFGHIFLNDHTRGDVLHAPVLVASEELPLEQWQKDYLINHCWVQNSWSASVNPNGAFFCEVAGALAMLFDIKGWPVEPDWFTRMPKDFVEQMDTFCKLCGCAMPLLKRCSTDKIDDISPGMVEKLKVISPKLKAGKYAVHDLTLCQDNRQMATYKDQKYRDDIAARYGLFLSTNERGFQTPHLSRKWEKP